MNAVRIAVCDDSRTYSHALKRFLERDDNLQVIALYSTAEELIARLPVDRPDLVTMDLELPGIDGVQATTRIMGSAHPVPVVVLSAHVSPGSLRAAAALAGGAVDAILKSEVRLSEADAPAAATLRRRIKRLARARVQPPEAHGKPALSRSRAARSTARTTKAPVKAIGIAASTGGPQALALVLRGLPAEFPIPVLVVQHITVGFTDGLASWLDQQTPLPTKLGTPGTRARSGVWFAPDGAHLTVDSGLVLGRDTRTKAGRHKPAANVLFASMAASLGQGAACVVLTGMGRDGAAGVGAVVAAGGFAIAQDEASSVVYGMPRAAVEAGSHMVLPIGDIAAALLMLIPAAR